MPNWIFIAMGTAILLASADVFVKLASGKLSNSFALVIFGLCTFSIGRSGSGFKIRHNLSSHAALWLPSPLELPLVLSQ